MVTTYGTSTDPVRIGDNATPGSGTYEMYLHPDSRRKSINHPMINGVDLNMAGGNNIGAQYGVTNEIYVFSGHIHNENSTQYNIAMQALGSWNDNNTLCFLTVKDKDAANKAVYPANTTEAITQWSGRIIAFQEEDSGGGVTSTWTIQFKRYTS